MSTKTTKPYLYFYYDQNNSGGKFYPVWEDDDGNEVFDIAVKSKSHDKANRIAEVFGGVYFDGVLKGEDCNCCGDRWSMAYSSEPDNYNVLTEDGFNRRLKGDGWFTPASVVLIDGNVKRVYVQGELVATGDLFEDDDDE